SGDAAGMIHPLCGNGMGMAIHSALLLSEALVQFFAGKIPTRVALETHYNQVWERTFRKRLFAGRIFNRFFQNDTVFEQALVGLVLFPALLPFFIRQTHGKDLVLRRK
ncbi:MAG: FAD-dependent oxidoreductase, partial [Bacteroidota bacterium]